MNCWFSFQNLLHKNINHLWERDDDVKWIAKVHVHISSPCVDYTCFNKWIKIWAEKVLLPTLSPNIHESNKLTVDKPQTSPYETWSYRKLNYFIVSYWNEFPVCRTWQMLWHSKPLNDSSSNIPHLLSPPGCGCFEFVSCVKSKWNLTCRLMWTESKNKQASKMLEKWKMPSFADSPCIFLYFFSMSSSLKRLKAAYNSKITKTDTTIK